MNFSITNPLTGGPDHFVALGWIVLLPLLGAVVNGLFGKRLGRQAVHILGVGTVAAAFVLSLFSFFALVRAGAQVPVVEGAGEGAEHPAARLSFMAWEWFHAPTGPLTSSTLAFRYVLDNLSGLMLLIVTGVGTLIHVYSTAYMSHDEGYARFFAYLNLFMFSMLNLILADSIVLLFVGWEGVGLCSYLLIGFWFTNGQYASAGRKAFIVNRIGDVGVILGMSILAWKLGTYEFASMHERILAPGSEFMSKLAERPDFADLVGSILSLGNADLANWLTAHIPNFTWGGWACFFLFVGCTGKSAQIPLYVWLPDAMAGPTPVSALIHAATMVTAGVYLLCRLSFLFVHFPTVLALIAIIGASTALFAATIAVAQNELKKVLAYSTVSQLGFMFLGCGAGAFSAGLFHVYTHAMFKACLFLGAGAVMHGCRDKQDIRELGGLRKYMPYTFWTFLLATLAIIGTPGFSGFFSKDEILFRALASGSVAHATVAKLTWAMGTLAATLTAFYMCRLLFLTFFGEFRGWSTDASTYAAREPEPANAHAAHDAHGAHDDHGHGNEWDAPHENPPAMTVPLMVLAFMSVVAGYIGLPYLFTGHESGLERWLEPVVTDRRLDMHATHGTEMFAMACGIGAFAIGSLAAYVVYIVQDGAPARALAASARPLYQLVYDKWRIDELYNFAIVRPLAWASDFAAKFVDRWVIDGAVRLVGMVPRLIGRGLRLAQNGSLQTYGAFVAVGLAAMVVWTVWTPGVAIDAQANGADLTLHAHGGPGYTYAWDLDGDGTFDDPGHESEKTTHCTPHLDAQDRSVCTVAVRVVNPFSIKAVATRTIEIAADTAPESPHP